MLIGTYEHNIDGKNRVFVPSKFRDEMGDDYVCRLCPSKYPSIQLYKKDYYFSLFPQQEVDIDNIVQDRRMRAKRVMGNDIPSCDAQGRIVLSPVLTKLAKLEKRCVFVGFETYVEIMSPETYENYLMSLYEDYIDEEEAYEEEEKRVRELRKEGAFISTKKGGDEQ